MIWKSQAWSAVVLAGLISSVTNSAMWCQGPSTPAHLLSASDTNTNVPMEDIQMKASAGHLREELELADDYFAGRGVTRDLSQAVYWYRKAAEQGDPGAQVNLGYFYVTGIGVKPDAEQAVRWFQRAAASGSRVGKLNLAVDYLNGTGVRQDTQLGLSLLNELARQDDPRGEAYLGLLYMLGVGVERNLALAEHWFERAAKRHSPEGEYAMGTLYSVEDGHKRDLERAAMYLRQSSDAGYTLAKHSLGLLLVNHPDLPQSPGEAKSLLEEAAAGGSWRSSVVLGILYRDGRGVPKDTSTAYRWFTIAAKQAGSAREAYLRPDLAAARSALSIDQQRQSEDAAAQWITAHPHTDVFVLKGGREYAFFPMSEVYATELAQASSPEGASIH
jgi:TPR repeat protein